MEESGIFSPLPSKLLSNEGEVNTSDVLSKSLIGVYFAGNFSKNCRDFTSLLAECFQMWRIEGQSFQIVYISHDDNEEDFKEHFAYMPWVAVPFNDQNTIKEFTTNFGIEALPTFVVLDNKGNLIDADANATLYSNNVLSVDRWKEKLNC